MMCESLVNCDWKNFVDRLGGAASLEASARDTGAFLRARVIEGAVDLLRMILAYCLGGSGLRCTAAWANAVGLADISNVALLRQIGALACASQHGPPSEKRRVRAAVHRKYPDMGGYAGVAANPMGPMQERFCRSSRYSLAKHMPVVMPAMRIGTLSWCMRPIGFYRTDLLLGRLFENAPGVSDATVQRLRSALLGMMDTR
jgi:hypothetical protein